MPQAVEASLKSAENTAASVEKSEKITSSNLQPLIGDNSISEKLPLQAVDSLASGNSPTKNVSGKVLEDPSICTDHDIVDQVHTLKKRTPCTIINEENKGIKHKVLVNSSDDSVEFPDSETSQTTKNLNEINSGNSSSSSKTLQEESSFHEDIASIDNMTEISQDARLSTIIGELSSSVESSSDSKLKDSLKSDDTSKENTSKSEDSSSANTSKSENSITENASKSEESSLANTSKSEVSSSANTSKSEDSNLANTSKSEDSSLANTSKSDDSSAEDSSKSKDSSTEDSSKSKHDSTTEQTSEDTDSDSCKKGDSNQNRKTRKRKFAVCERKESSDSDKETSSSGSTPNKQKKHSVIRRPSTEYFPQISEDSSESGNISEEIRDGSSKDSKSFAFVKGNFKQVPSSRKRKLSTVCEVAEGDDGEAGTSSSNDSRKSIKRLKTATKTQK